MPDLFYHRTPPLWHSWSSPRKCAALWFLCTGLGTLPGNDWAHLTHWVDELCTAKTEEAKGFSSSHFTQLHWKKIKNNNQQYIFGDTQFISKFHAVTFTSLSFKIFFVICLFIWQPDQVFRSFRTLLIDWFCAKTITSYYFAKHCIRSDNLKYSNLTKAGMTMTIINLTILIAGFTATTTARV